MQSLNLKRVSWYTCSACALKGIINYNCRYFKTVSNLCFLNQPQPNFSVNWLSSYLKCLSKLTRPSPMLTEHFSHIFWYILVYLHIWYDWRFPSASALGAETEFLIHDGRPVVCKLQIINMKEQTDDVSVRYLQMNTCIFICILLIMYLFLLMYVWLTV
jgi:hypothetical protein